MNILISGIGSDIGFNSGRILRDWNLPANIYGIDINSEHAGSFVFDEFRIAPSASDPSYLAWVESYIIKRDVQYFLPTSEAEISYLSNLSLNLLGDAKILLPNSFTVSHSLDKHLCMDVLSTAGLNVPEYGLVGVDWPKNYPVVVKPRSGRGSKNVLICHNAEEVMILSNAECVWQSLLLPDKEEYTCPVYRSPNAGTRILILKRTLQGGLTGSGEVKASKEIEEYVYRIAQVMDLNGPMNVQLRLTKRGPVVFEINPRLSSTVMFRDKLGFCDLKWWILESCGQRLPSYINPEVGTKFYRGAQEYIVPANACVPNNDM